MRKSNYIISILFLLFIFAVGGYNMKRVLPGVLNNIKNDPAYRENFNTRIEDDYRQSFVKRSTFIDGYGIVQKAMQRNVIGNIEFIREKDIMSAAGRYAPSEQFLTEMQSLKDYLDEKEIPLLYVQMPVREDYDESVPLEIANERVVFAEYRRRLGDMGVEMLTGNELLGETKLQDFYFKTDIHPKTSGEIQVANKIAEKLEEAFDIQINDLIQEDDPRFIKKSYAFDGNLVKSAGKYYIGADTFEEYVPMEQPHYNVENYCAGVSQQGNFEEVIMNDGMRSYLVTSYLRYGCSYYNVNNMDSDGPNLLIICDSYAYRTISYLSLQCQNITIIDPRFYGQGEGNPIPNAIESRDYDCVIYLHGDIGITTYSMYGQEGDVE